MKILAHKGISLATNARRKIAQIGRLEVKRILVIRHAAFGDMILTRPFLLNLKNHFPHAHIILSTSSRYQVALPDELVDEIHTCFSREDNKSIWKQYQRLNEIKEVDLIFDLAATSKSMQLCMLTKARFKMGFPYKKNHFIYDACLLRSDLKFEAEVLLDFLNLLGLRTTYPLDFSLPKFSFKKSKKRISYFMGASSSYKQYPLAEFLKLIESMSVAHKDYEHHVLQGVGENEKFHEFFKSPRRDNIKLIEVMSLPELATYLSESRLLISNDTGVKNYAICTHTPSLVISVSEHPFRYLPRYEFHHYIIFNDIHKPIAHESVQNKAEEILRDHYGTNQIN